MLPDRKDEKLIFKVRKRVKYDDSSTGKVNYNTMHENSSYEFEYPFRTTDQLEANIIEENTMSQVDPEVHHYRVLTEVTGNKKGDIDISKVYGFIKSSSGNLHLKRTTCGW